MPPKLRSISSRELSTQAQEHYESEFCRLVSKVSQRLPDVPLTETKAARERVLASVREVYKHRKYVPLSRFRPKTASR